MRVQDQMGEGMEGNFTITVLDDDSEDNDGDGLSQAVEEQLGTSDQNTDTDGDGFADLEEVNSGSDPNDPNAMPSWLRKIFPSYRAN